MIVRYKPDYNLQEIISIVKNKQDAVEIFEEKFAQLVNAKYAITFPSGRFGLYSLLKASKLKKQEIITPAYNCVVVPSAVIASGNTPRFWDITLTDYNMKIPETNTENKIKAYIPTHMYGYPMDIKHLREIAGRDSLIFEDAAQAILTKEVGRHGDATFYSFNYEKQLFTFGGGMVTTDNEELYQQLKKLKTQKTIKQSINKEIGKTISLIFTKLIFSDQLFYLFSNLWSKYNRNIWSKKQWEFHKKNLPVDKIYISDDYQNYFTRAQAAAGISQLEKIKKDIRKRKKIAEKYHHQLQQVEGLMLPPLNNDASYAHYTIRTQNRTDFERFMKKQDIQINKVFEYSIPHLPRFTSYVKNIENFKNSYIAGKNNVNLPIYPQMLNDKKINKVVKAVKKYYQTKQISDN